MGTKPILAAGFAGRCFMDNNYDQAENRTLNTSLGPVEETYRGLHEWWQNERAGNLFPVSTGAEGRSDVQRSANNIMNAALGSVEDTYRGLHQWFREYLHVPATCSAKELAKALDNEPADGAPDFLNVVFDCFHGGENTARPKQESDAEEIKTLKEVKSIETKGVGVDLNSVETDEHGAPLLQMTGRPKNVVLDGSLDLQNATKVTAEFERLKELFATRAGEAAEYGLHLY
jgi:hypothetical protein